MWSLRAKYSKEKKLFNFIKNVLGFYPGNISLYRLALTHKSAASESFKGILHSNERLEFLGDAILGSVIGEYLYKKYPLKDEGFLTEMRSRIVNRVHLNKLAINLGLKDYLISNIQNFTPTSSIYGDSFEALIGAIFLDKGYKFTRNIIINRIVKYHIDVDLLQNTEVNFKSRLLEWAQKEKKEVQFNVVEESTSRYPKLYTVELLLNNEIISSGQDFSIKKAEQNAAETALQKLI
ncbi:MAG: ribonuclease III [Bacteroidota bacterium]|nr:ribonuclease III [Bacteroidota bacterium]